MKPKIPARPVQTELTSLGTISGKKQKKITRDATLDNFRPTSLQQWHPLRLNLVYFVFTQLMRQCLLYFSIMYYDMLFRFLIHLPFFFFLQNHLKEVSLIFNENHLVHKGLVLFF